MPLAGGEGTSWRVGGVVLKPHVDRAFQEWLGTDLAAVDQRGFRLPRVLRAVDGAWVVAGWGAHSWLPGSPALGPPADLPAVIEASRALHRATAGMGRPPLLDRRTDAWAWADAAAWGEVPLDVAPELRSLVGRLATARTPPGVDQVVHGDLAGNVLLLPGEPPAVIDFSPYWRPASYAEGIVVADALCWSGAQVGVLEDLAVPVGAVARGLLFRVLCSSRLLEGDVRRLEQDARRYDEVAASLGL